MSTVLQISAPHIIFRSYFTTFCPQFCKAVHPTWFKRQLPERCGPQPHAPQPELTHAPQPQLTHAPHIHTHIHTQRRGCLQSTLRAFQRAPLRASTRHQNKGMIICTPNTVVWSVNTKHLMPPPFYLAFIYLAYTHILIRAYTHIIVIAYNYTSYGLHPHLSYSFPI